MDLDPHRTCIARFDEPLFCPSSIETLLPPSLYQIDLLFSDDLRTTNHLPLVDSSTDQTQTVEPAAILSPSTPTQQQSHSGSQSADNWPEPPVYVGVSSPPEDHVLQTHPRRRLGRIRRRSSIERSIAWHEESERLYPTPVDSDDGSIDLALPSIADTIEEDALPVDDPRRSYDFAEFMDNWRLQYLTGENVPVFESGFQPSVKADRILPAILREEDVDSYVDIQGLNWDLLGPRREYALMVRKILHPSRIGVSKRVAHPVELQPSLQLRETEWTYRFRAFHPQHVACPRHYQLRHMMCATSRSQIFYADKYRVFRTSLACPDLSTVAIDLSDASRTSRSFTVTCLSTVQGRRYSNYRHDQALLAGGFSGEYAMLDLTSESHENQNGLVSDVTEGFVNHAYNGIVNHINTYFSRRSGSLEAAFCSNDRRLQTFDIKTRTFTHLHTYAHAINCSDVSPDGRLRLLVGDSNEAYITDAERCDILAALQGHNDHGFACAWAPSSRLVATGAQDGKVLLWDPRKWSCPLETLRTKMSCARSLHFTDDDTLVIAESEDVVSFYNERNPEFRQDLQFFGSIAGLCVLDGGAEIAVANADRTVGGLLTFERTQRWSRDGRKMTARNDDSYAVNWFGLGKGDGEVIRCSSSVFPLVV